MSNPTIAEQDRLAAPAVTSASTPVANPLLHGPLLPMLIRLALPTVAVLLMTTVLAIAETYFVSSLGIAAIAAASLVVPVVTLMGMVSNGGIGGGVSSSIARARGAGRLEDAESLAWHAVIIGIGAGALFTIVLLLFGRGLYSLLGGSGEALQLALGYSNILFAGAIPFWVLMLLQSALRGAGNVKVPAMIMLCGTLAALFLSPALIVGWLGLPHLGIAGAGVAQVICNLGALAVAVSYMRSPRSNLRLRRYPLRKDHFEAILGIGLISMLSAIMTTLSVTALTAAAGVSGIAAIAGYGIASRLDMLLIPVMFGFGTAAITVVGTNLGAGNVARARKAALVNALFVAVLVEVLGLVVAMVPTLWLGIFTDDPDVLRVGADYLRLVAPLYAFIAITLELFFAGQGAGRIGWPLVAGMLRFACAVVAAVWVILGHASLHTAFILVAVGVVGSGLISLFGFWRVSWAR